MPNQIVWFDMPVQNLERAMRFYSAVVGGTITKQESPGLVFAVLHDPGNHAAGCLVPSAPDHQPSANGVLMYFNCQGRLDQALAAVEPNGGKILAPKHPIGPYGFRAVALDSEGNRIALHST